MKQKIIEITRWLKWKNPYYVLKGARNEIRLLIEENERLLKELESARRRP